MLKDKSIIKSLIIVLFLWIPISIFILLYKDSQKNDNNLQNALEIEREGVQYSFVVTADMRKYGDIVEYNDSKYFKGILEDILNLNESFLFVVGDLDPVNKIDSSIKSILGEDYIWYPVVGNHELPDSGTEAYSGENIEYLREFKLESVNAGPNPCPETTYSFDYRNTHFVVLNEYCNEESDIGIDGDVSDTIYSWLESDLEKTNKEIIFVFGHEPAFPQADQENERLRHVGDSLDQYPENRDRFWDLLTDNSVVAYFCGHTHNYSIILKDGVWQIDAGHARGAGDTGAKSTYIIVSINDNLVEYETFRINQDTFEYESADKGQLTSINISTVLHI